MKNKLIILLLTSLVALTNNAMQESGSTSGSSAEVKQFQSYNGIEITPKTIGSLSLRNPLADDKAAVVKEWRDHNRNLLKHLMHFNYKNSQCRAQHDSSKAFLAQNNIKNNSDWNYAFALPTDESLYVHISGPVNRVCTLMAQYGKYNQKLPSEELDALEKVPTFQTLSRAASGLIYRQFVQDTGSTRFHEPATYIMPMNDAQDLATYSDENSFVIQERINPTAITVHNNKERLKNASISSFRQLLAGIHALGLWGLDTNLLIDEKGEFWLTDIEGQNHNSPADFFNKNDYLFHHAILCGFEGIYKLCDQNPALKGIIREYVQEKVNLPYADQQKQLETIVELNK